MQIEQFKSAVGKFPTGVTVISTNNQNKLYGFTANTFTSVSLMPPLVSFCLDRRAGSFQAFRESNNFSVSILANDQKDISVHFASHIEDKFMNTEYELGSISMAPLISGAIAFIECTKYREFECGDHFIFIGEVKKTQINNDKSPLLYFARSYFKF